MTAAIEFNESLSEHLRWIEDYSKGIEKTLQTPSSKEMTTQSKYALACVETPIILEITAQIKAFAGNNLNLFALKKLLEIEEKITLTFKKYIDETISNPLVELANSKSSSRRQDPNNLFFLLFKDNEHERKRYAIARSEVSKFAIKKVDSILVHVTNLQLREKNYITRKDKLTEVPSKEKTFYRRSLPASVPNPEYDSYVQKATYLEKERVSIEFHKLMIRGYYEGLSKITKKIDGDQLPTLEEKLTTLKISISNFSQSLKV